jgi:hypothetical protein
MGKRKLADRILDEILTLRRPRTLMMEMDSGAPVSDDEFAPRSEAAAPAGRILIEE